MDEAGALLEESDLEKPDSSCDVGRVDDVDDRETESDGFAA